MKGRSEVDPGTSRLFELGDTWDEEYGTSELFELRGLDDGWSRSDDACEAFGLCGPRYFKFWEGIRPIDDGSRIGSTEFLLLVTGPLSTSRGGVGILSTDDMSDSYSCPPADRRVGLACDVSDSCFSDPLG